MWGFCWDDFGPKKRGLLTPENRAASRARSRKIFVGANVIGVIVGR